MNINNLAQGSYTQVSQNPLNINSLPSDSYSLVKPNTPQTNTPQNSDTRNPVQKALGAFLDPIIQTGFHAGEAVGDMALTGINKLTGGALDKYTPEGNLSQALQRTENTSKTVPVFGTKTQNAQDITPENTAGNALSTVALGAGSATAGGALIGAGNAMQQDQGAGNVAVNTVASALGGKILEYGFNAVSPYIEKAAIKYGSPIIDQLSQYIPDSAKGFMSDLSSKVDQSIANSVSGKIMPQGASDAITTGSKVLDKVTNAPFEIANAVHGNVKALTGGGATTDPFQQSLNDAQQVIYPKLTPTESANVPVQDVGSGIFKKSIPDLVNYPGTKPILESVANLPEDIRVSPNNTLAQNDSNLSQGISRLHSDTDAYLASPKIVEKTTFEQSRLDNFMQKKVLDPIANEYGADSFEYKAAQDAIKTGNGLLPSQDASGVYQARQGLDKELVKEYPRAFSKQKGSLGTQLDPRVTARIEGARAARNAYNDFISEELLPTNDPYRPRLQEESNLITAKEQMRSRGAGDLGKNKATLFMKNHPNTTKIINRAAEGVGLGGVIKFIP